MALEQYSQQVSLSDYTTLHLGGQARYFRDCQKNSDLTDCLQDAKSSQLPLLVLGGGSNIIIPDNGFNGIVAYINSKGITFTPQSEHNMTVTAHAGENWDAFVRTCIDRNLTGLECLSGIPGNVGATPIQNVGAYGHEVKSTITNVQAIDRQTSHLVNFNNEECQFSYRFSRFKGCDKDRYIITQVEFCLPIAGEPTIIYDELQQQLSTQTDWPDLPNGTIKNQRIRDTVIAIRRKKSMVLNPNDINSRSVGSFFTNPILDMTAFTHLQKKFNGTTVPHFPTKQHFKIPAAWLIEQAGFYKGYRHKGVGLSSNHNLALININGTTAQLMELATIIQDTVAQKYGVALQREPVLL